MDIPDPRKKQQLREEQVAENIMIAIADFAPRAAALYEQMYDTVWMQKGWDVATVNRVLRRMDAAQPGYSVTAFALHAKLGELLAILDPDAVKTAPVPRSVNQQGQLILDERADYPEGGGA